jgi:outer membrane lipoprotein-sorting protein
MKRFFAIACLVLMALLLVIGCGQKKEEPQVEQVVEETIDMMDTVSTMIDSTLAPDTAAVKEAIEEVIKEGGK